MNVIVHGNKQKSPGEEEAHYSVEQAGCLETDIKEELEAHLSRIGILRTDKGTCALLQPSKDTIRARHSYQYRDKQKRLSQFVVKYIDELLPYFASGKDIVPDRISPRLEIVHSDTRESRLFRLASLTWSVPVSEGFGRRMRLLVWDDHNQKLIGIIGLGDPVFNMRARDEVIGWTSNDRRDRLVHLMDAYVLGALPPYNMLLAGKLIACLIRTTDIVDMFSEKYAKTVGIISGKAKRARLAMVTTTSALGRSSIYNRLRLDGTYYFKSIGYTSGYGHFQIPDDLFLRIREYLKAKGHVYSSNNRYGNGPNWKFRAIRAAMELMGISRDLLRHGIRREVFVSELATNATALLKGDHEIPIYDNLEPAPRVGAKALERWVLPRASRRPEYKYWQKDQLRKAVLP